MMDQASEARVIEVLGRWLKGRTLVLCTHRLQLLAWVDRIALIEHGRILAEGPRDEMVQKLSVAPAPRKAKAAAVKAGLSPQATTQTATKTAPVQAPAPSSAANALPAQAAT
jgi:ATP-binding cassette subfamily C protein LapB